HSFDPAAIAQMQFEQRLGVSEAAVQEQLMTTAFDYHSPVSAVSSSHDLEMYLSSSPPRASGRALDGMMNMSTGGIQAGFQYQPGIFSAQNFGMPGAGQDISCIRTATVVQAQGPHHQS